MKSARPSPTDGPATTTNQAKNNIGLIAGAVAGGVAVTLIVAAAVYCCQCRRLARGQSNFSIDDEGPAMAAQHGPIIPFVDGTGVNAPGRESVGIPSVLRTPDLNSRQILPPLASPYGSPSVYMSGYSVNEERHSSIPRDLNRTNGVPDRTSQYASGTSSSAYAASDSASPLSVPSSSSAGKVERQLLVANDLNEDGRGGLGRVIPQTEAEMLEMRRQMQLMKMQIDHLTLSV
ncbi:hypothetical protein H0H81_007086 [Sphagnurus paluster]|uniref:Uncharacterized protein n=1 Tax=Sphagnurus paluster TaxID=117069 RepID=A0A9P7K527_9AGAR|nr:hypothetical protein H0H81_007086 [Sphagnurus paluster]